MNSTYWLNTIMDAMYVNSAGEFYLGLSSTLPNKDGSNVSEPAGASYARVKINSFTAAVDGTVYNTETLTFPKSTEIWFPSDAKAAYWVLFDGAGNFLSAGELNEPKTIESSTTLSIEAETLGITLMDYDPDLA